MRHDIVEVFPCGYFDCTVCFSDHIDEEIPKTIKVAHYIRFIGADSSVRTENHNVFLEWMYCYRLIFTEEDASSSILGVMIYKRGCNR